MSARPESSIQGFKKKKQKWHAVVWDEISLPGKFLFSLAQCFDQAERGIKEHTQWRTLNVAIVESVLHTEEL